MFFFFSLYCRALGWSLFFLCGRFCGFLLWDCFSCRVCVAVQITFVVCSFFLFSLGRVGYMPFSFRFVGSAFCIALLFAFPSSLGSFAGLFEACWLLVLFWFIVLFCGYFSFQFVFLFFEFVVSSIVRSSWCIFVRSLVRLFGLLVFVFGLRFCGFFDLFLLLVLAWFFFDWVLAFFCRSCCALLFSFAMVCMLLVLRAVLCVVGLAVLLCIFVSLVCLCFVALALSVFLLPASPVPASCLWPVFCSTVLRLLLVALLSVYSSISFFVYVTYYSVLVCSSFCSFLHCDYLFCCFCCVSVLSSYGLGFNICC